MLWFSEGMRGKATYSMLLSIEQLNKLNISCWEHHGPCLRDRLLMSLASVESIMSSGTGQLDSFSLLGYLAMASTAFKWESDFREIFNLTARTSEK